MAEQGFETKLVELVSAVVQANMHHLIVLVRFFNHSSCEQIEIMIVKEFPDFYMFEVRLKGSV